MVMRLVDAGEVGSALVDALGLGNARYAPASDEVLACAIRRFAAIACPCPRRSLVRAITSSLEPVLVTADLADRVDEMIDSLVAHCDLAEVRASDERFERAGWLVHVAPPSFVRRTSGAVILLGVAPDEIFPLPKGLQRQIHYRGHVRVLVDEDASNLPGYLSDFGLLELNQEHWLSAPTTATPQDVLKAIDALLDAAPQASAIPDMRILDWSKPVSFYKGRWVEPKRQTGRFIVRRPQAYGAPLWSYLELEEGSPGRLLDLPRDEISARGCDEAWRIQAAIDAARGSPQQFRRRDEDGAAIIEFFSPLPRWAARRFAVVGDVAPRRRSLFSIRFPLSELDEELTYIREELWLDETKEG
jgi:hypothetical protein